MAERALAIMLIVIGCLLAPLASVGVWTRREVLDTSSFTNLADDLLAKEAVRNELADRIVRNLERSHPQLAFAHPGVVAVVRGVMPAPAFKQVFRGAVHSLHGQLVNGDEQLTLDLSAALALISADLGRINPNALNYLPSASTIPVIVIAQRSDKPIVWDAVNLMKPLSWFAPLTVFALLFAGVLLADRRWRALGIAGVGVVLASLALIGALRVGRSTVASAIGSVDVRAGVNAGWDVIGRSVSGQTLIITGLGAVAAFVGFGVQRARDLEQARLERQ
jgi:hypothetical protein